MRAGIGLRDDFSAGDLRQMARRSDDADQTRRLLAIAVILDGGSRSDAARTGGVGLQVIRDWVLRFNESGPEGLRTRMAPGKSPILTDEQREQLAAAVEAGPQHYAQDAQAIEALKKTSPTWSATSASRTLGRR